MIWLALKSKKVQKVLKKVTLHEIINGKNDVFRKKEEQKYKELCQKDKKTILMTFVLNGSI
jgi:hypothetical protein